MRTIEVKTGNTVTDYYPTIFFRRKKAAQEFLDEFNKVKGSETTARIVKVERR